MKMMVWQEKNCFNCAKAVFYNQRLKRMPQFKCAVQKQIEGQANGEMEINQRTFDAVQNKECPFFKSKFVKEETNKAEILPVCNDFVKGQSLVKPNQEKPKNEPKQAQKTKYVKVGNELVPENEAKEAEKRMFATIQERMQKGELPPSMPDLMEEKFRKDVKHDIDVMLENFTWKENMMIAFVPLMLADMAWHYADKVMKYCADHKISIVKKLGRAIKQVKTDYETSLNQDLDWKHIDNVRAKSTMFMEENKRNFTILWFTVNSALKREHPDMEYSDMRTDACLCIYMIDFLYNHNKRMDDIIASKMGAANSIMHPDMLRLKTLVDAYLPENFAIKDRKQIDLAFRIIQKDVERINFVISDKV